MGGANSSSRLENQLKSSFPENERFFGLENSGNVCYCNSVLQALFYCVSFREHVLRYYKAFDNDSLLSCLADLFHLISSQSKRTGIVSPQKFVVKLRSKNELFRSDMHHDAHEFLNYVLNTIDEELQSANKRAEENETALSESPGSVEGPVSSTSSSSECSSKFPTFVQSVFQGKLVSETKCRGCDSATRREEPFFELSVEIEPNCSLKHCLSRYSARDTLFFENKFFCEVCHSFQEATKRLKVSMLPPVLVIHLKRFMFNEQQQQFKKLSHRVVFPFDIVIPNALPGAPGSETLYSLFAVVMHFGTGPFQGHYMTFVKSGAGSLLFDDDYVKVVDEATFRSMRGPVSGVPEDPSRCSYLLFYQCRSDDATEDQ